MNTWWPNLSASSKLTQSSIGHTQFDVVDELYNTDEGSSQNVLAHSELLLYLDLISTKNLMICGI